jgi:hypothetical protein
MLITFDESVTSSDKIIGQLAARGYAISGAAAGDPAELCN